MVNRGNSLPPAPQTVSKSSNQQLESKISIEAVVGQSNEVNNSDHTQFRIYFNHSGTINEYAGWYSGESEDGPPQLLVRYKE
jgi:hypothetical protein